MQSHLLPRLGLLLLLTAGFSSHGLGQPMTPKTTRSFSGQFVMVAPYGGASFGASRLNPGPKDSLLELNEMLLPVSCERIKECLAQEFGMRSAWRWEGKIYLVPHPARVNETGIVVASERFNNAWQYRIQLPNPVDRTLYVHAVIQALLTEMANRQAADRCAEVPVWLIEGLTRHIMTSRQIEVILSPPTSSGNAVAFTPAYISSTQRDPLRNSHQVLQSSGALTFEQLSWPSQAALSGPGSSQYTSSAHFFVYSLLRLPNGRECMRTMLERLPAHENWQFSFFEAFREHFQRPLDVEKWWTLQTVYFVGHDVENCWSKSESEAKLRDVLRVGAKVYESTNSLPKPAAVTLQDVLLNWKPNRQEQVLKRKAQELEQLRLRVAPEYLEIVEQYRSLLADTLERRAHAGLPFGVRKSAAQASISREAARELDLLDARLNETGQPLASGGTPLPSP